MLNAEVTPVRLAQLVEVDVKTVQRWLTEDRMPYPVTRHRVAQALAAEETYLWPRLLEDGLGEERDGADCVSVWPTRTAISSEMWHNLFGRTVRQLDILVYAGEFLMETLDLSDVLRFKADRGATIRVLVGDPRSAAVQERAGEFGTSWGAESCRMTLAYLEDVVGAGVCVRSHRTTLYASLFRFDDTLLVNAHAYAIQAAQSPVFRLGAGRSQLFGFYLDAFERVWASAAPASERMEGAFS